MSKIKLVEIADSIFDGKHGDCESQPGSGLYFISVKDLKEYDIDYSNAREITPNDFEQNYTRTSLDNGDTIYANTGDTIGKSLFVKDNPLVYKTSFQKSVAVVKPNIEFVEPRYLYYLLKYETPRLRQAATGSGQKNLLLSTMRDFEVTIHDRNLQKNIISVLGLLDDKIRINIKINDTLYQMAKTLYDYWFVQFDFPDENGKPYRTSGGEMVWNEQLKREIPKGWKYGKLCDIANITMGQSPAGESYNDAGDGLIFYQGRTDFGLRFPTPRMYTTAPTRFAQKGDILLSVRAPVGDLNFAMEDCCIGRGLAALNSRLGSQMHLFYTLAGFQQIFKVMDGNGTTFGSITKDTLFDMGVVIPPDEVLKCFEKQVKPIESKIEKCEEEIRELTKLRDWLLPMLMNGQARVE